MKTKYVLISRFLVIILAVFSIGVALSVAIAQTSAFSQAQQKAHQARQAYSGVGFSVDQPIWKEALVFTDQAYRNDPQNLDVLRFATIVNAEVGWDSKAWNYGREFVEAGGTLDNSLVQALTTVGNELGYSFYEQQNYEVSLGYYQAVAQINPNNERAAQWIARIYTEVGNPEQAALYWEEAKERGSADAEYFLERSQLELSVGKQASDAQYSGIQSYEEGNLAAAMAFFGEATQANPNYIEGWRWLGRTSLEAGLAANALTAWQRLAQLDPSDASAKYFVTYATEQVNWGNEAGEAFMEALGHYENQRLLEANQHFVRASMVNANYLEAIRWAARSYQELGNNASALDYWQRAQKLAPEDESITYFIRVLTGEIAPASGIDN